MIWPERIGMVFAKDYLNFDVDSNRTEKNFLEDISGNYIFNTLQKFGQKLCAIFIFYPSFLLTYICSFDA